MYIEDVVLYTHSVGRLNDVGDCVASYQQMEPSDGTMIKNAYFYKSKTKIPEETFVPRPVSYQYACVHTSHIHILCTCAHTHIHTYTHTHTHTHTHTYTHTYIVHVIVVTQARVLCLICTHDARGRTYQAKHECLCCN